MELAATSPRSTRFITAFSIACLAASLAGCEDTSGTEDEGGARGNILLADENNYESQSSLTIPSIETASATDLDICWQDALTDLRCHDVAPAEDVDNVALLRFFHLSEEEVADRLTAGQLEQAEVDGYLEHHNDDGATCTKLSAMSFFETEIDIQEEYVESSEHTYMLLFARGTTPGVGAHSMIFVKPTAGSTNTVVEAQAGCGLLEFSADLSSVEPVAMPQAAPWVVDWRNATRDGQNNPIAFESIDGVLLGFYEGMTVAEIQEQIFDLEEIATSLWEIELSGGRTADLAVAQERSTREFFPGFERDRPGVWLLGLTCSTCQNPAPIMLMQLDPQAGAD